MLVRMVLGLTNLKTANEELKLAVLTKHLYNNVDEFIFQSNRYTGTTRPTIRVWFMTIRWTPRRWKRCGVSSPQTVARRS
jgi:hypothetical protein